MAVDRNKVLSAAQKHLSKGNYDRAIAEYEKLVAADPRDVRTWLKIGDLHTRKGDAQRAGETYHRVAEHYAGQGFFLKAVAVYKQILKLQPARIDVQLRLAEMYENLQLVSDALATYEEIAATHNQKGDVDSMLATLARMADLDPENVPVRIRHAEALSKAGRMHEAAQEFEAGATLLDEQGRVDDYLKVAERLLYHRQEDQGLARELAERYLERNDAKRALAKLQLLFQHDPKDVVTLEMLARAFHLLGQTPKTISVYKEIARILFERDELEGRARVLKRILELDPRDAEARQALAAYAPRPGASHPPAEERVSVVPPAAVVVQPVSEGTELYIDDEDAVLLEDDDSAILEASAFASSDAIPIEEDVSLVELEPAESEPPRRSSPPELQRPLARDPGRPSIPRRKASEAAVPPRRSPGRPRALGSNGPAQRPPPAREATVRVPTGRPDPGHPSRPRSAPAPSARGGFASRPVPTASERPSAPQRRPAAVPTPLTSSVPPDVAREAQVARLLTEVEVFARYGLRDKVFAQLEQVVEIAPDNVEAREKLKDAYLEAGLRKRAAGELLKLASLFPDKPQIARLYLHQARTLGDGDEPEPAAPPVVPPPPGVPDLAADATPSVAPESLAPDARDDDDALFFVDAEASAVDLQPLPETGDASLVSETDALLEELDGAVPVAPADAPSLPPFPTEGTPELAPSVADWAQSVRPTADEVLAQGFDEASSAGWEPADAEGSPWPEDPPAAAHEQPSPSLFTQLPTSASDAAPAAPPAAAEPSPEILEVLEEVDFFMAQRLWDAAMAELVDALEQHPSHPSLLARQREVEDARTAAHLASAPPARAPKEEDKSFALAEKLAEELEDEGTDALGSDVIDVDAVFAQFKKGVEEQVGADDTDTHFDLGIAYKEMGLFTDAVVEFELAMASPGRACLCHTMVGLCFAEQDEFAEAIGHFKKGLYAERKTEREELGLFYEIGHAYERLGDVQEALYYFQKATRMDPQFRGVRTRVERLRATLSSPGATPAPLTLDVDSAFGDLPTDFDEG